MVSPLYRALSGVPQAAGPWPLVLFLLFAGGCSLVGSGSEPPAADLTGMYSGVLRMEGDDLPSTLIVSQDDGDIEATLSSNVGLNAEGEGRLSGTVLRIEMDYGTECSGSLTLAGQILDEGARLVGTVDSQDCTGSAQGSFSLSRR